jgi:hypothetical protein
VQLRWVVQKQKSYRYAICSWRLHAETCGCKSERCLRIFGAIEIAGTRWCGKTWCALMHAKDAGYVDEKPAVAGPLMLRRSQMHGYEVRIS